MSFPRNAFSMARGAGQRHEMEYSMSETIPVVQQPQTCPVKFPLERLSPPDPAAEYGRLREEQPIIKVSLPTEQEAWLVTRHADVRSLLVDERMSADRSH